MNVRQVVERVERQYLEHPDELWVRTRLVFGIDETSTQLDIDLDLLSVEEQALVGPGVLLQIDFEQMIVSDVVNETVTVRRGMRGTDAEEHDAGAEILVAPPYTRDVVFDAVSETIVGMHPPLFAYLHASAVVGANGVTQVPADTVLVQVARRTDNNNPVNLEDLGMWPDEDGIPRRSIRVFGEPAGTPLWIGFRARFRLPTSPGDVLSQLGVKDEWARIVVVGAAAQLVAGKPMSNAWKEYVSAQMRSEAFPAETPNRIRDALVAYHEYLINRAAASLQQQHPMMLATSE
jgi:hypothetical protein